MSATTGDSLAELGRWLNAEVFTRPFRPVDLHEYAWLALTIAEPATCRHYVIGNDIFNTKKQLVRKLTNAKANSVDDVLLHLVKEVVPNSCVLLFCCTKKETQDVAERLAAQLPEVETHKVRNQMCRDTNSRRRRRRGVYLSTSQQSSALTSTRLTAR